jgi:hypothetical protein
MESSMYRALGLSSEWLIIRPSGGFPCVKFSVSSTIVYRSFRVITQYSLSEDVSLLKHPPHTHTHSILPSSRLGVCKSSKGRRKKGAFFYWGWGRLMASREGDEMLGDLWHDLASHNCSVSQCQGIILVSLHTMQSILLGKIKPLRSSLSKISFLKVSLFCQVH